jgi:hypothetical protein
MAQDIPNIIRGVQEDYKKLYYSESDAALKHVCAYCGKILPL